NDIYNPIHPLFSEKRQDAWWYLNGMDEHKYPDMWLARIKKDENIFHYFQELNNPYDQYAKSDPTAWAPPMDSESKNGQALNQAEEDFFIRFLLGNEDLNSFDNFIENTWKEDGGAEIVKEVNDWYSEQKK